MIREVSSIIEKQIESSKGTVYYWTNEVDTPRELAIVFCHGLTADHTLFDMQVKYLSAKYRLITWDWPLHGKSRPYRHFSFSNVNKELLTILEQEQINKIILVGQSAGGYIAQSFIRDYEDKVKGFIGIGTTPFGKSYYRNFFGLNIILPSLNYTLLVTTLKQEQKPLRQPKKPEIVCTIHYLIWVKKI